MGFKQGDVVVVQERGVKLHGAVAGKPYTVDGANGEWCRVMIRGTAHVIHESDLSAAPTVYAAMAGVAPYPAKVTKVTRVGKSDPLGKGQHEKGAKLDAGKLRPVLILRDMNRAITKVVEIATNGAAKYTEGGWLEVPNGNVRYEDAQIRHMLLRLGGEVADKESGSLHLAHEAWNALAKLELYLRAEEKNATIA